MTSLIPTTDAPNGQTEAGSSVIIGYALRVGGGGVPLKSQTILSKWGNVRLGVVGSIPALDSFLCGVFLLSLCLHGRSPASSHGFY